MKLPDKSKLGTHSMARVTTIVTVSEFFDFLNQCVASERNVLYRGLKKKASS